MADDRSTAVEIADTVSELLYAVVGWVLIAVGLLIAWQVPGIAADGIDPGAVLQTLVMAGFAMCLFGLGVFVNPRFRRRLDRRHELTRFGRARSVDERVLRPEEERRVDCVACLSSTDRGLVRRSRDEYVVAGIPVWTRSENERYYCAGCAEDELSMTDRRDPDAGTDDVSRERTVERE